MLQDMAASTLGFLHLTVNSHDAVQNECGQLKPSSECKTTT